MGFQRGNYGVEYERSQKSSTGKLWLLSIIIPLIVLALVLRGCGSGKSGGVYDGGDTPAGGQAAPEVAVERERPSIAVHFLQAWRGKFKGKSASDGESAADNQDGPPAASVNPGSQTRAANQLKVDKNIPAAAVKLWKRVDELEDEGDLVSARMILQKLRLSPDAAAMRPLVEKRIGEINMALIFSASPMPGKLSHTIVSGDLVSKLTRKYNNTEEYILRTNRITHPERIQIGQKLWVLDNPSFELMIDKSDFKAVLLFNRGFFKAYTVGLGDAGSVAAGAYELRGRGIVAGARGGEVYRLWLKPAGNIPETVSLSLNGAESESHLGMASQESGVVFSKAGIEELYVLLPAGSVVTIVE
ncbi:MAG: LysM domain-containing protein [Kiritimatiellae bacterium]|nr:LysM domain-containing protein [Kiritimatiellia bacterium]